MSRLVKAHLSIVLSIPEGETCTAWVRMWVRDLNHDRGLWRSSDIMLERIENVGSSGSTPAPQDSSGSP